MTDFSFNKQVLKDALKSIFEKEYHPLSKEEEQFFEETFNETSSVDDTGTYEKCDEIIEIERQNLIEDVASALRIVVVSYIDLQKDPYPYKINRDIPLLKDCHKKVMQYFSSPLYPDIVKYSEKDMFIGDLRLLEEYKYRPFFVKYSQQPESLNLHNIKELVSHQYEIDNALFEL